MGADPSRSEPLALRDRLRRLAAPPRFADPELDRLARGAFTVALVSFGLVVVWIPVAWLTPGRRPWALPVGFLALGLLAGVAALARTGRARAAVASWLVLLFGMTLLGLWREGGLQGITASNSVVVVLAASLFFPGRAAWGVAAVVVATLLLFLGLEQGGMLVPREIHSAQILVSLLVQMSVAILMVQLLVGRIRQTERFLRQVADTTPHAIYVYDLDEDKLAYGNSVVSGEFGYPVGPAPDPGGAFGRVIVPEDRPRLLEHAAALARAADEQVLEVEYRALRPGGLQRWIRDRARVFDRHDDGRVRQVIGVAEDVTQARETEQALRESHARLERLERMEALGQLAGGVAHDFNNYLTVILGSAEDARSRAGDDPLLRAALEDVLRAARGSAELARQLLAFSRRQVLQPRVLDLNEILRDADRLLRRLLPENVEIETVASVGLGRVRADPTQIEQVIVNLALNARDAMPEGGRLTLETLNVVLDEEYVARHPGARPGQHVRLVVSDTGTGIDEATLEHIFEPLFTTKEATAGTGLGLATVEGIVRQSGGSIEVRSRPGRGAEFRIQLPRVEAELEAREPEGEGESAGGHERVLLVEDESMVRRYACRVLQAAGYRVTALADGRAALAAFERDPDAFDVLVSDVMLPGCSGPELVRAARQRRPGLPVLFTSGYIASGLSAEGAEGFGPDEPVLSKPFTPPELRRRLREVLARGATPPAGGPAGSRAAGALPDAPRR